MAGLYALYGNIVSFLQSSYGGVDFSVEERGGLECLDSISLQQRLVDTCVYTLVVAVVFVPRVLKRLSIPQEWEIISLCRKRPSQKIFGLRKMLLVLLCVIFGIEIGYRITSHTLIYLLNPNHILIMIQMYLLAAEPTRICASVFRIHLHYLFQPMLVFLLPSETADMAHGEVVIYWIQHTLIAFFVPSYLINISGAYRPEPLKDFSWVFASIPIYGFYTFYVLQPVALLSLVNLNNTLCPAPGGFFTGPNFRWYSMVGVTLLNLMFGKIYTFVVYSCIKAIEVVSRGNNINLPLNEGNRYVDGFIREDKMK